ncbi:MAG: pitrilysin family protein [Schleiferiaceae bacterium]|nr:pitrilysin family protein [Schleiferiaceae bacterium]
MKRILITLIALASFQMTAQLDRSIRPQPAEPRIPTIAQYTQFTLKNGMTVLVVEDHKLPRLSVRLSMDPGQILEGDKAGVSSLTGDLLSEGTTLQDKASLDAKVDYIGARLSTSATSVSSSGLSKYSEQLFHVAAEVAMQPAFPEASFDKLKNQFVTGLKNQRDNPGAIRGKVSNALLYGVNHPNGEMVSEASVEMVTLSDCESFYKTYWKPNIATLTIVGDIAPEAARALAEQHFGSWKGKFKKAASYPAPAKQASTRIVLVNRDASVQSSIMVTNTIELPLGHPDVESMRVMNQILGSGSAGRLFQNLREDKAYTYGAYSSFSSSKYTSQFEASAEVRNAVTDSAVAEFLFEINRIRTESVSAEDLRSAKNNLAGGFGRSLERPETVASFAYNTKYYGLSNDYYNQYLTRLEAVTATDVQRVANTYIEEGKFLIVIVGKGLEVSKGLERLGFPIDYYTLDAEPTTAPVAKVPTGLTAQKVIDAAFEAMGGREAIEGVQNIEITQSASLMGMTLDFHSIYAAPNYIFSEQKTPMGSSLKKYNGYQVVVQANGQDIPVDEAMTEEVINDSWCTELLLSSGENGNVKLSDAPATVGDALCYELVVTLGSNEVKRYYDAKTGFCVRQSQVSQSPQGEQVINVDFSDYQSVDGVYIAHSMKVPLQPGMDLEVKTTSVTINGEVDKSIFD